MSLPSTPFEFPRMPDEEALRHRVKRELRKRAQGVRKTTPANACFERSTRIAAQLEALAVVRAARAIALFWPIEARHEVDLRAFGEALRARGVRVAYPAIERPMEADGAALDGGEGPPAHPAMTFRFVDDIATLEERGFGFLEPPDAAVGSPEAIDATLDALDVVIVPALALDPTGQRIGYGAGYYDRALEGTRVTKVGVGFDFQLLSEIPHTLGDVPMDWVVTDRRVFETSASGDHEERASGEPSCPR